MGKPDLTIDIYSCSVKASVANTWGVPLRAGAAAGAYNLLSTRLPAVDNPPATLLEQGTYPMEFTKLYGNLANREPRLEQIRGVVVTKPGIYQVSYCITTSRSVLTADANAHRGIKCGVAKYASIAALPDLNAVSLAAVPPEAIMESLFRDTGDTSAAGVSDLVTYVDATGTNAVRCKGGEAFVMFFGLGSMDGANAGWPQIAAVPISTSFTVQRVIEP